MRRAAKVDANQPAIVEALRDAGCLVQPLNAVGDGCPDLAVGCCGRIFLFEVKDGSKPPSAQKLTPAQEKWMAAWVGYPVRVVRSEYEAVQMAKRLVEEGWR